MFFDITEIDSNEISGDICIVGAGAAGISLAKQFLNSSLKIILLEAGGMNYEQDSQDLYQGENEGLTNFPLNVSRLRYFGGTTGHWGGACVPLDPVDFEKRDWLPHSGWPFARTELEPYYPLAQKICGAGPYDYSVKTWSHAENAPPLPLEKTSIESQIVHTSKPIRFGTEYRDELEKAKNIHVILHSNVIDLITGNDDYRITEVRARNIDGRKLSVKAREFVLCTGGIENPRLLLLANKQRSQGLGNQNDLVGRYFMDHIHLVDAGELMLFESLNMKLYERRNVNGTDVRTGLSLSQDALRKNQLMNSWLGFKLVGAPVSQNKKSLNYLNRSFRNGDIPEDMWRHVGIAISDLSERISRKISRDIFQPISNKLNDNYTIGFSSHSEQAPNPDSRVYLGDDTDRFGQRKAVLDWRLMDIDHASIRRTIEYMAQEMGATDLGRILLLLDEEDSIWSSAQSAEDNDRPSASFHHIGTTRMSNNPKQGVVDENLKIHDLNNLYVLGSSVFPTCGFANPTLTIVALSCRLADHFKTKFA